MCALSFGTADFIARFSSRAIGYRSALLGTLIVGTIGLTAWVAIERPVFVWPLADLWLLPLTGIATTVFLLLLYLGLARGPISVVAPIVAAHPVFILGLAVVLGSRPTAPQWLAIGGTLAGSVLVAVAAEHDRTEARARRDLAVTIAIAVAASLAYAVAVAAGQAAVPIFGELPALWISRGIGLAALILLFVAARERPSLPKQWLPVLAVQGTLDTMGLLFLFLGSAGAYPEIAAVTGSTFGAITTLLAWLVLKERIGPVQAAGIVLVFVCVGVLAAQG